MTGRPRGRAIVEESDGRLLVHFPPREPWRALPAALLLAFLGVSTASILIRLAGGDDAAWSAASLVVLCVASFFVARSIARMLWGHESIVASTAEVEVTRFGRSRRLPLQRVRHLRIVNPYAGWDENETLYALELRYDGGKVRVGYGLDEDEAEWVAQRVRDWLTRRSGWFEAPEPAPSPLAPVRSALFPAAVVLLIAYLGYRTLRGA